MILTDWSNFKNLVDAKSLSIQWIDMNGDYICVAVDGNFSIQCNLNSANPSDPDTADFIANYKDKGNQPIKAGVIQHLGSDTVTLCPFGVLFPAAANQSTTYDYQLTSTVQLKGGIAFASPGNIGDQLTVQIVDKNNILGAGANTIIATYVNGWYVIPGIQNSISDISLSEPIPVGLFVRFIYLNSSASTTASVIVNFLSYEGQ